MSRPFAASSLSAGPYFASVMMRPIKLALQKRGVSELVHQTPGGRAMTETGWHGEANCRKSTIPSVDASARICRFAMSRKRDTVSSTGRTLSAFASRKSRRAWRKNLSKKKKESKMKRDERDEHGPELADVLYSPTTLARFQDEVVCQHNRRGGHNGRPKGCHAIEPSCDHDRQVDNLVVIDHSSQGEFAFIRDKRRKEEHTGGASLT